MIRYALVGRSQQSHDVQALRILCIIEEPQMLQHFTVQTVEQFDVAPVLEVDFSYGIEFRTLWNIFAVPDVPDYSAVA